MTRIIYTKRSGYDKKEAINNFVIVPSLVVEIISTKNFHNTEKQLELTQYITSIS